MPRKTKPVVLPEPKMWAPSAEERKHIDLIVAMSVGCLVGKGAADRKTYISNLRMIADLLEATIAKKGGRK
jgi:hypothetical protein